MRSFLFVALCVGFFAFSSVISHAGVHEKSMVIKVEGMTCVVCVAAITESVSTHDDVASVMVDLETSFVTVIPKDGKDLLKTDIDALIQVAGYQPVKFEAQE